MKLIYFIISIQYGLLRLQNFIIYKINFQRHISSFTQSYLHSVVRSNGGLGVTENHRKISVKSDKLKREEQPASANRKSSKDSLAG